MGADVAGREPGDGMRKKRRSMVRIPADEVPRPNSAAAIQVDALATPAVPDGPADELVNHAFSNGGVAEGVVPASLHLPGYEPEELASLDDELVDDDLQEEPDELADEDVAEATPEEADTDPRALHDQAAPPPAPPAPSKPDPQASIAALVRAVAMPPPPTVEVGPSPWSESAPDEPVLSSVASPVPTARLVNVGAEVAGRADEEHTESAVLAPPTTGPTLPPPAGLEPAAPPPAAKEDEMELSDGEMEEVDTPAAGAAEPARARSVTPVVPPPTPPASPPTQSAPQNGHAAHAAPPPTPKPAPPPTPNAPAAAPPAAAPAAAGETPLRPRKKRRAKQWFEEVFDDDYLRTLPFLTARQTEREAGFVADSLGVPPGGAMLDLACGYGRHAMELAGKNYHVTGLDLSLPLLIRAADAARRSGLTVNFIHGDMREMTFEDEFDGAYCMFTSFGYFDDDTNRKVAANLARAIKPGGKLLIDVVNRDYLVRDLPTRVWWQGEGCVVLEEVDFNYFSSRLQVQRSIIFEDGRQVEQEISIRAYSLHEIGKILHHAGFRVTEVSGGLALRGKFFGASSRQLIVLAEKKPFTP